MHESELPKRLLHVRFPSPGDILPKISDRLVSIAKQHLSGDSCRSLRLNVCLLRKPSFEYLFTDRLSSANSGSSNGILGRDALTKLPTSKHVLVRTEEIIISSTQILEIFFPGVRL